MNPAALQIYSFMMQKDIQFIRYCHPAYQNRIQWKQVMKKSKLETDFPAYAIFLKQDNKQLILYLYKENTPFPLPEGLIPATDPEIKALCKALHCEPHTLSPLGVLFDRNKICHVVVDNKLCTAKTWCLSPCSDVSSVLITPDALLHQFLPATAAQATKM